MRSLIAVLFACLLTLSSASAQTTAAGPHIAGTPSDQSIRRLLDVRQAKAIVDALPRQMDAYFTSIVGKMLEGKPVTEQQRQAMERMKDKLNQMIRENFNWESMEGIYLEIYRKTFSQSEIDSMIRFYSSPAGHAVVVKLPLAMQNAMATVQQRMQTLIPKIEEMAKETATEVRAPEQSAPTGSHD